MNTQLSPTDRTTAEALLRAIRFFSEKGWSPATSTNYSCRVEGENRFLISRSGVDKSLFHLEDLILMNEKGQIDHKLTAMGIKSSAETEIHTAIYQQFTYVDCVLHTHSPLGTFYSQKNLPEGQISFSGWEVIKGISGHGTHETTLTLPIVPNSQEMAQIIKTMEAKWDQHIPAFLIAGHGLYAWGKSIAEAKRHIETIEFLLELHHLAQR